MDFSQIIVVDTETGGLDPDRHPIWQVAWGTWHDGRWTVTSRLVQHDRDAVTEWVKEHTSYRERFGEPHTLFPAAGVMAEFAVAALGKHIAGMVPSFDEERIRREWVRHFGYPERFPWHYHLIDVEALMVGHMAAQAALVGNETPGLPWKSHDLSARIGVTSDPATEHSALADARWAKAVFERIMGEPQ